MLSPSDLPAGVGAVFETGALLFTAGWLELVTTAVFDLLAVVVVELFVVVFAALPQAEKSNANEAMLNIEKVVILIFSSLVICFVSRASLIDTRLNLKQQN